jgi:hypothetical protein
MSEKPPWRTAIENYERAIGAPLEEFIKSDEFADMAANAAKQQTQMQEELGQRTTQWLHSMNLPAASDVAELRAEVQALREDVRTLTLALALEREKSKPGSKPKSKPKSKAKSKAKPNAPTAE